MATRPHRGQVATWGDTQALILQERAAGLARFAPGSGRNGLWRPDDGFQGWFGVRIVMRREHGVTTGDVLRVPFRFQVPTLSDLSRSHQYNWATYDTVRVGQRSRPQGRQLLNLQVDTMLMDGPAADAASGTVIWKGIRAPQRMIQELRWIMGDLPGSQPQVFRLVLSQPAVWGGHPIVNMLATLTALQPTQRTEEIGTEYISATFLEYPVDEQIARKQRPQSHGATRWTLKRGDTLYEIAKKSHFHRPSAWKLIARANGITGVSPSSASELAAWAKKHHKTTIIIPAAGRQLYGH